MGDETRIQEDSVDGEGCPLEMPVEWYGAEKCGLPLHLAPEGVDLQPVCLMHSKDPAKEKGQLSLSFWERVEAALAEPKEQKVCFRGYVFPRASFKSMTFLPICDFAYATFVRYANFAYARFERSAYFYNATFGEGASFVGATFKDDALFMDATCSQQTLFSSSVFECAAKFSLATFEKGVNFSLAKFYQAADFAWSRFEAGGDFNGAEFEQIADYSHAKFGGPVNWERSNFNSGASFSGTRFHANEPGIYSANFSLVKFAKPEEVIFKKVDLSRALFHDCDIRELWFTSSVTWGETPGRKAILYEEFANQGVAEVSGFWIYERVEGIAAGGHRDYKAVAQIYQQLKKNYDDRLDYWTANDFHFGEMEMQRLDGPWEGPLPKLRQWWHRRLSLVALYRLGSDYGNSFKRPLCWLIATLLLFTALFPMVGLSHLVMQGTTAHVQVETFATAWRAANSGEQKTSFIVGVLGHGFLTAVDTASFQRNIEYAPVYPWGRVLAIAETLLTSTLVALFFLALRRQFRR